ncbi:MAG: DUF4440 domain-containing protein [Holophagales bacterium]|nr:DUF4440 domain-containing protein [Holophagales bacterium]
MKPPILPFLALAFSLATGAAGEEAAPETGGHEARVVKEIEELHRFFEGWFLGILPDTDEAFARFADALDGDFMIVSPSGRATERAALLEALRGAHGAWGSGDGASEAGAGGGRIWIENVRIRHLAGDLVVATYEEWQQKGGEARARGRLSTVVFRREGNAPGGLAWLHVHETWLPST